MKHCKFTLILITLMASLSSLSADNSATMIKNSATTPTNRLNLAWWKQRHKQKVAIAKNKPCDLLFIGDSITHNWEKPGKKVWKKFYSKRKAINIGFSGDRTEHVLWRLDHGEFPKSKPKVAILMIGTNNTGQKMQKAAETAQGIKAIINKIQQKSPKTHILLLAIFPRDAKASGKMRQLNNKINNIIKTYDDGKTVHFLNINSAFLKPNGDLPKSIMPDYLHPQAKGHQIWAKAIEPTLKKLLK